MRSLYTVYTLIQVHRVCNVSCIFKQLHFAKSNVTVSPIFNDRLAIMLATLLLYFFSPFDCVSKLHSLKEC